MDSASNDKGHRFFINYIVSQMDISVCFERAAHNFAMYDTDSYNAKFPIEKQPLQILRAIHHASFRIFPSSML